MIDNNQIEASYDYSGDTVNLTLSSAVFRPTGTTELLVRTVSKIDVSGKVLDLGCGSGIVGIMLKKKFPKIALCMSDLSDQAVEITKYNLGKNGVAGEVRCGSLFAPWPNSKFDFIVNDVSGISEEIALNSSWFQGGVPCKTGRGGADLTLKIINSAYNHLNKNGSLVIPVLSLANESEVVTALKNTFATVNLLAEQLWPLPEELLKQNSLLQQLERDGQIKIFKKFGMQLWRTSIYQASI
jgi:16S rRNA G1207 methylase RsmC